MANSTRSGFAAILCIALVAATTPRAQQFTKGTYAGKPPDASTITITFADDGRHTVKLNGEAVVDGKYNVKGDQIEFVDLAGPVACDQKETGVYAWKLDSRKLSLTAVKDSCAARLSALTSQAWTLQ
jgi:hypothetical protein